MTKTSDGGIEVFKKAGVRELENFLKIIEKFDYTEVVNEEKIKTIFDKNLQKPKRASSENVLQAQYRYKSQTGYTVYIHTSLINLDFADKGKPCIMILNEKGKKVFFRNFSKNLGYSLLQKLSAYANFCKRIADDRKPGFELFRASEALLIWKKDKSKYFMPFVQKYYTNYLSPEECKIVTTKERMYFKRLIKTIDTVDFREEEKRSTWKKPKNNKK